VSLVRGKTGRVPGELVGVVVFVVVTAALGAVFLFKARKQV